METVKVLIKGKVQGVSFRSFIKEMADKLELNGYVKNIDDDIEALFQGLNDNVMEAINLCKKGPKNAAVEMMKVTKLKEEKKYNNFEILR